MIELVGIARRLAAAAAAVACIALAHAACSTTSRSFDTSSGAGGASTCQTPQDCPGMDTECAHRTCIAETCGMQDPPEGFLVAAQTSGDCQRNVCDGQGATKAIADDADVPNDGNPCTVDACDAGKPTHTPAPMGTPCGATGALSCDGAGNCAGCTADADCGMSGDCVSYTCVVATTTCAIAYVPSGQGSPAGQLSGDCKKIVCNGSGGTAIVNDDTDVPNDGNACTKDLCSAGQPSHAPEPAGTSCGGNFQCDGSGNCAGCKSNADCGQDNACATFQCVSGACQTTYVPYGQGSPGGQTAGDCQKIVCNGNGGTASVADDTDVGNDNNPCTQDACSGGVPQYPPLGAGTPCGGKNQCDGAGNCVCVDSGACNGKCGTLTNACGQSVDCGGCAAPNTCGGGGVANVCGCSDPDACINYECGFILDACGVSQNCGACDPGYSCKAHICQCLSACL